MLRKFAFDEIYAMLREYVSDPKARQALLTYDAEYIAGRGELLDGSQCSELAFDSYGDFKAVGWSILAKHGWPTYSEVVRIPDVYERSNAESIGMTFITLARRLIRKEPDAWGWWFQDEDFDIADRASVLKLLQMRAEKNPNDLPYTLTGDE